MTGHGIHIINTRGCLGCHGYLELVLTLLLESNTRVAATNGRKPFQVTTGYLHKNLLSHLATRGKNTRQL
ncbi:MAG TPA: hypothetical protein EYN03_08505 [Planctomycetes bacterium]|nr:hypothetical protein [Planctomycetota bacterium]